MRIAILEDYQRAAPGHPLASLPNVTATPHLGCVERGSYEKYFGDAFDAVNAFASGKPIRVVP